MLSPRDQTQKVNNQVLQGPHDEVITCPDKEVFGLVIFAFASVIYLSTCFTTALNADSSPQPHWTRRSLSWRCLAPKAKLASFSLISTCLKTKKQSFCFSGMYL